MLSRRKGLKTPKQKSKQEQILSSPTNKVDREQEAIKKKREIVYKNPKINELAKEVTLYTGNMKDYEPGEIVRLKNNAIAQVVLKNDKKIMLFISPNNLIEFARILSHQRFANKDWPNKNEPDFRTNLHRIFAELGLTPLPDTGFNPDACVESETINKLNYYQKIVTAYLVYSKIRGLLVWHSMGAGKTCTSIDVVNQVIKRNEFIKKMNMGNTTDKSFNIYVVLPPAKSLEENFRTELSRCPSSIRKKIKKSRKREDLKMDLSNTIINKHLTITTYISLSNKVKNKKIDL